METTLDRVLKALQVQDCHPGILLDYGLESHDPNVAHGHAGLLERVTEAAKAKGSCPVYEDAYTRWKNYASANCATREIGLLNRMHIGLGIPSVLETNVTLHPLFGLPMIPGEALKGALRSFALASLEGKQEEMTEAESLAWQQDFDTLFGRIDQAAVLVMHDAWWVPKSASLPLHLEVETPHHGDYYKSEGQKPATDYDDPNLVPQLAVQGKFLVALDKASLDGTWAEFALDLLHQTLATKGIGGRLFAGYGRFVQK
ncbi:MAG: type III-B CRISPR module RAMP protein Cmr6 [Methylococcales bacterium]